MAAGLLQMANPPWDILILWQCMLFYINQNLGFSLAGVAAGNNCYCGKSIISLTNSNEQQIQQSHCSIPCPGDVKEFCGGLLEEYDAKDASQYRIYKYDKRLVIYKTKT